MHLQMGVYNFFIWAISSSRLCSVSSTVSPLAELWFKRTQTDANLLLKICTFANQLKNKTKKKQINTCDSALCSDLCWNGVSHGDSLWEVRPGARSSLQLCVSHLGDKFDACSSEFMHIKRLLIGCPIIDWSDKDHWPGYWWLTPLIFLMHHFLFFLHNLNFWMFCFPLL